MKNVNVKKNLLLLVASSIFGLMVQFEFIDPRISESYYKYKHMIMKSCFLKYNRPLSMTAVVDNIEDEKTIGLCYDTGSNPKIEIKVSYYLENKDNAYMDALVAHELTHCMLHQPHTDKKDHFMNAMEQRVTSKKWLEQHVQNFLNERCYE